MSVYIQLFLVSESNSVVSFINKKDRDTATKQVIVSNNRLCLTEVLKDGKNIILHEIIKYI